jgi:hypothetical protein
MTGEGTSDPPAGLPPQPGEAGHELAPSTEVDAPAVRHHFVAPALIPLDRIDDDRAFLVRSPAELDDVATLATDLARLGQLFPIDVRLKAPDRFQVVTGFRRVAALRFLQRDKVLARLHTDLTDEDAQLMALASAIHGQPVGEGALLAVKERLAASGALGAAVRDMLDKALATDTELAPEEPDGEVDADELARDVTVRLSACNQDLAVLMEVFSELDPENQEALLQQLRYSSELVDWLESKT